MDFKIKENMKKNRKLIKNAILILILISVTLIYVNNNYIFIRGKDLFDKTNIILTGNFSYTQMPVIKEDGNIITLPLLVKREVSSTDLEKVDTIYETIEIDDLIPYKEYNYMLQFNLGGIDFGTQIKVGTQGKKPDDMVLDKKNNKPINNINLDNAISLKKGNDEYMEIPIVFEANEEGKVYIYIGIDVKDKSEIDYTLSNLRLKNVK